MKNFPVKHFYSLINRDLPLFAFTAGELLIYNISSAGVSVDRNGAINTNSNAAFTVQNNPTVLRVADGNISLLGGGNSIIDNDQDIILESGTHATFDGDNTIGNISCDNTVLIRGNQVCQ